MLRNLSQILWKNSRRLLFRHFLRQSLTSKCVKRLCHNFWQLVTSKGKLTWQNANNNFKLNIIDFFFVIGTHKACDTWLYKTTPQESSETFKLIHVDCYCRPIQGLNNSTMLRFQQASNYRRVGPQFAHNDCMSGHDLSWVWPRLEYIQIKGN